MKEDTIDKIAYLTGRDQFRAESCTSPEKKEAYSEIYNDLRGLLELARDNESDRQSRKCNARKSVVED